MPRLRLALCLAAVTALTACAGLPGLPPRASAPDGPAPALVDLDTLPAVGTAEDPGAALLRRADALRGG